MSMTVLEAIKLVQNGDSENHINRFISAVKYSSATGLPAHFDFDDAMVAAIVLSRLTELAEGRKLLGLPKRKNTKYKASDFPVGSPQSRIADDYKSGKKSLSQAKTNLSESLHDCPDLRTAERLLFELVERNSSVSNSLEMELAAAGARDDMPGSRDAAACAIFERLAGPDWAAKLQGAITSSPNSEQAKDSAMNSVKMLLSGAGSATKSSKNL